MNIDIYENTEMNILRQYICHW